MKNQRKLTTVDERSERASAASEASGAFRSFGEALRSKTEPNLSKRLPSRNITINSASRSMSSQVYVEVFLEHKSVLRGSSKESDFQVDFKMFKEGSWSPSWRQVGPKLAQKWSKFRKKSDFWGFRCQLLFLDGFLERKSEILEGFEAPRTLKIEPPLQREHEF